MYEKKIQQILSIHPKDLDKAGIKSDLFLAEKKNFMFNPSKK